MSLEPGEVRRVLGHLATGVTVVTCRTPDGVLRGLTATAVASVSLHPPLALVCVDHGADSHEVIERSGAFAINILAEAAAALVWADCELGHRHEGGDHTIFAGRAAGDARGGAPLLHYRGGYRRMAS